MIRFAARRLLLMVPTLWVIATLTFFMLRLAPGGPFLAERDIPKKAREAMSRRYGLDQPLGAQYLRFLGNAARLDLGPSYRRPALQVREILFQAFPVSLELGGLALGWALLTGGALGVLAAHRRNSWLDYLATSTSLLGVSIPNFVLGPLLVLVFSLRLYWFPPALWSGWDHKVLPVLTLSAVYTAYIARLTRAGMVETLGQDFVRTARAKGLSESRVVLAHALRPGLLPVVSYLGPATAGVVTGSVAVESIFAVPGLGRQLYTAAINRDYTVVLGAVLFYAALLLVLNLVVDLLYARLDPRVEEA
ncbi:MAG: ABC transporter permease [Candidatus Eisenbacteria bacterium]|nr:ABC transporter permease [Candidatus Eisenbacteria bacterium]